ncbi:hypothetical protein BCY84_21397 [Trypanosoma cruzi cruzi]|nr:hypothetical protein BCY84_21397 [Trypanosoma cruzi cruzi]
MTTALCASPAARMRRGRDVWACDEGLWGGAHISSLLFCFLCGQGWQTPAAPHTQPHPAAVFFVHFLLRSLSRWSDATAVMSACFSQSHTHTSDCALRPHSRTDGRAEGSSNTQTTP